MLKIWSKPFSSLKLKRISILTNKYENSPTFTMTFILYYIFEQGKQCTNTSWLLYTRSERLQVKISTNHTGSHLNPQAQRLLNEKMR